MPKFNKKNWSYIRSIVTEHCPGVVLRVGADQVQPDGFVVSWESFDRPELRGIDITIETVTNHVARLQHDASPEAQNAAWRKTANEIRRKNISKYGRDEGLRRSAAEIDHL